MTRFRRFKIITNLVFILSFFIWFSIGMVVNGHDLWLLPRSDNQPNGIRGVAKIDLAVGSPDNFEILPRMSNHLREFFSSDGTQKKSIPGQPGLAPAGILRKPEMRNHPLLVHYTSFPVYSTLPAEKFNAYLVEENLHEIVLWRKKNRLSRFPGRETYTRYAKTILNVDPELNPKAVDWDSGQKFQFILNSTSDQFYTKGRISGQLIFENMPARNHLLKLTNLNTSEARHQYTDSKGRFELVLSESGFWMISSVKMLSAGSDPQVDWKSFWTTTTFPIFNTADPSH